MKILESRALLDISWNIQEFWFSNDNNPEVYIGSADWMENLDRRIEAVTPIEDPKLKSKLHNLLQTYINDNFFSWIMKEDGSYEKQTIDSCKYKSQTDLIENWQNY